MPFLPAFLSALALVLPFAAGAQAPLAPCPGSKPSIAWTNCTGTLAWPDGATYTGAFRNGKRDGRGRMKFPDAASYDGDFLAGQYHGYGSFTFADGSRFVGEFRDGKRNGQGIEYGADGKILQSGFWENNAFVRRE